MSSPGAQHRLSGEDFAALGTGELSAETMASFRAAELSKHLLLFEALRRRIGLHGNSAGVLSPATEVLSEVQAHAPDLVADVFRLPHMGFWAASCLSRDPTATDLAHLSAFAAVAAIRSGCPFELEVPVRQGVVVLPTLGTAHVAPPRHSGWARIRLDQHGAAIRSAFRTVRLPAGAEEAPQPTDPAWNPTTLLTATVAGVTFRAVLEVIDPFLVNLSPRLTTDPWPSRTLWQERISAGWSVLARHHRPLAERIASCVTTLIPLRPPVGADLVSATSGLAWGAIAMSLPVDNARLAETLVHEFLHLVLAAAEDFQPLAESNSDRLHYAPWRDDPRPSAALLQGTYAQFGVAGFWRRQRHVAPAENRWQAEVEFARARRVAFEGTRTLVQARVLTPPGDILAKRMQTVLEDWRQEPVPDQAESLAVDVTTEHLLRWRLSHLRPDATAIDETARAWMAGQATAPPIGRPRLAPFTRHVGSDLSKLLDACYKKSARSIEQLVKHSPSRTPDEALVCGDYANAVDGYLRQIKSAGGSYAWVGLLLALRHLAKVTEPVTAPPEVVAAAYDRILELTGTAPDAMALVAWVDGY